MNPTPPQTWTASVVTFIAMNVEKSLEALPVGDRE